MPFCLLELKMAYNINKTKNIKMHEVHKNHKLKSQSANTHRK